MISVPGFIRVAGGIHARFAVGYRGTRIADLMETGGFRFRFPTKETDICEAVLINTGGGMTGGDALRLVICADEATNLLLTTQAAEKIYRSNGPDTILETRLDLGAQSKLAWLPQETILFSGARIRRSLYVQMDANASLLAAESVIFGRSAMGERLELGSFRDRWRIRRDDRLIFAEDIKLEGQIHKTLQRKAIANGAAALATILLVSPEAETRLDAARERLADFASEAAAGAWNGMLVIRLLAQDAALLRRDMATCLTWLRGLALPRVWQC